MKTADKSFSSKAMKVLLSIALVIGLAPAISPAKAYAAATTANASVTVGGTETQLTAGAAATGTGWSWNNTTSVLTINGTVDSVNVANDFASDITIKAGDNAKISAPGTAAISGGVAGKKVILDTTAAPLTIETKAGAASTPATSAIAVAGELEIKAGTATAPAKALTITSALTNESTPVVAVGKAFTVGDYAQASAATITADTAAINGVVTGAVTTTGTFGAGVTAPASVTGNITSGGDVTLGTLGTGAATTVVGNITATGSATVSVAKSAAGTTTITGNITSVGAVTVGGDGFAAATIDGAITSDAGITLGGLQSSTSGEVKVTGLAKGTVVTLNDSAKNVATDSSMSLAIEAFAVPGAITLQAGATVTNESASAYPVNLGATGKTAEVAAADIVTGAPATYTYANWTAAFKEGKGTYAYKATAYTADNIKADLDCKDASGTALSTNLTVAIYDATKATAQSSGVIEAGSYFVKVTDTGTNGAIWLPFTVSQGSFDKVRLVVGSQSYADGVQIKPAASADNTPAANEAYVAYVTATDEKSGAETLAFIPNTDNVNYTLSYGENAKLGTTGTVTATFTGKSIAAGTKTADFKIVKNNANYLPDAVVTYVTGTGATADTPVKNSAAIEAGLFDSITINGGPDQKANLTYAAFSDEACTKAVASPIIIGGRYFIKITGANYVGQKVVPLYVADTATLAKTYDASLANLADVTFTGGMVKPATTKLTLTNKTEPSEVITFNPNQYTIEAVSASTVGAQTVTRVKISDTTSPYFDSEISTVANNGYKVLPLDLSNPALNLRVGKKAATYATDFALDAMTTVYTNANADVPSEDIMVLANVNGNANTELAIVDTENGGVSLNFAEGITPKNAGAYDIVLKAKVSTSTSVVGSNTKAGAFTITPFDLSLDTSDAAIELINKAANSLVYSGLKQALATVAITPTGGSAMNPVEGVDYEFVTYKMVKGVAETTPTDAINAGTYKVAIKALNPNLAGISHKSISTGEIAQFNLASGFDKTYTDLRASYPNTDEGRAPTFNSYTSATLKDAAHLIPTSELKANVYADNTGVVANAKVTLEAKADSVNFKNSKQLTYGIVASNSLAAAQVTLDKTSFALDYDAAGVAKAFAPKVTSVVLSGKTLKEGTDYTVAPITPSSTVSGPTDVTVTGTGTYTGANTEANWSVVKADLANATLSIPDMVSTDAAQSPAPVLKLGGHTVTIDGTNLQAQYSIYDATAKTWSAFAARQLTNAGKYKVKVIALNDADTTFADATETAEVEFTMATKDITGASVAIGALKTGSDVYTSKGLSPIVDAGSTALTVAFGGSPVAAANYQVHYYTDPACLAEVLKDGKPTLPVDAGTYYLKVSGINNFTGMSTRANKAFVIKPATLNSTSVAPLTAGNYNATEQDPAATLTLTGGLAGTTLTAGKEYSVAYDKNKVAIAKPLVDGTDYHATVKSLSPNFTTVSGGYVMDYTINKVAAQAFDAATPNVDATKAEIMCDPIPAQLWTGKPIVPEVTGLALRFYTGVDARGNALYKTVSLAGNKGVALTAVNNTAAHATAPEMKIALTDVEGVTNLTATKFISFAIAKADSLAVAKIAPVADQAYTGKAIEPALNVTSADGIALTKDVDYTAVFSNNTNAGKARVTITGKGNYTGENKTYFNITSAVIYNTLSGETELGTMIKIQEDAFATGSCDTVIVATSGAYYDALAASGLAGALKAKSGKDVPVLITDGSALSYETASTIAYLGAKHIIIAGGELAVSADVEKALKVLAGVTDIKRVAGATEIETAIATNTEAAAAGSVSDTAVLATSAHFADALSAAPYAYAKAAPIYLASADGSMTAETAAALKNFKNVKIVGGTAVVSETTAAALKAQGNNVERWAGDDCYQTSADIATKAVAAGVLSFDTASVATGKTYYDALSASAAAGSKKSVLLLVDEGIAGSFGIDATLAANKAAIHAVNFLGGPLAVTPKTQDAIKAALA